MLKRICAALALALLVAACGSSSSHSSSTSTAAAASSSVERLVVGWLDVDAECLEQHHDRAAGDELVEHQFGGELQLEQLQLERQSHPHPAAQPDTALRRQAEDRRR